MSAHRTARSNAEWLSALADDAPDAQAEALGELERYLRKVLARALRGRDVGAADLDDFVQDSLLAIHSRLGTFRGDARFTTWAAAVATRTALTHLRRRAVRERGRQALESVLDDGPAAVPSPAPPADDQLAHSQALRVLSRAIEEDLTPRQRAAIVAELKGLPTVEIADQLRTNANALYKLVHDARKRLRSALESSGVRAADLVPAESRGGGPWA